MVRMANYLSALTILNYRLCNAGLCMSVRVYESLLKHLFMALELEYSGLS